MNSCFRMLGLGAIALTLTAAVGSASLAQDRAPSDPAPMASPADRLGSTGEHDTLSSALDATAVLRELSVDRPLTLFAPTDQAFEVMPAQRRDMLLLPENQERLKTVLAYHLVPGRITAEELEQAVRDGRGRATLRTISGAPLSVRIVGDTLEITDQEGGRARIMKRDLPHSEGIIHVIDAVLIPRNIERGFTPYR